MSVTIEQNPPPIATPVVAVAPPFGEYIITPPWFRFLTQLYSDLRRIAANSGGGGGVGTGRTWSSVTSAATINTDLAGDPWQGHYVVPASDISFAAPTNLQDGGNLVLSIEFGGTTYAITFDAAWKMAGTDEVIRLPNTRTMIEWEFGPSGRTWRKSFESGLPLP